MKTHTRTLAAFGLATTVVLTAAACAAVPENETSLDLIPHVHDVAFDPDGAVLVGAHTGVYRVDPTTDDTSLARGGQTPSAANTARQIAEERLARGEITPDEFRQVARALEERT